MALDFMVIGLPRSGTTWAANWLTIPPFTYCVHDPLYLHHYEKWDTELCPPGGLRGVACTGIWRWLDWVNEHPARKLILHRPWRECADSLEHIGMHDHRVDAKSEELLERINGMHVPYQAMFYRPWAERIWRTLVEGVSPRGTPFNAERHAELVKMRIEPQISALTVNRQDFSRLYRELLQAQEDANET
jgi:hypothetical protein